MAGSVEVGEKYNGIEIVAFSHIDKHRNKRFTCVCHCGTIFITAGRGLKSGRTKSCGCSRGEKPKETPGNAKSKKTEGRDEFLRLIKIWHGGLSHA